MISVTFVVLEYYLEYTLRFVKKNMSLFPGNNVLMSYGASDVNLQSSNLESPFYSISNQ